MKIILKKYRFAILSLASLTAFSGCLTRAPTDYELDKRGYGGAVPVASEEVLGSEIAKLRTNSLPPKQTYMPAMLPPVIEKIWVTPQILPDGSKLDGTWLWIQVDGPRWLEERDPGSAPLILNGGE